MDMAGQLEGHSHSDATVDRCSALVLNQDSLIYLGFVFSKVVEDTRIFREYIFADTKSSSVPSTAQICSNWTELATQPNLPEPLFDEVFARVPQQDVDAVAQYWGMNPSDLGGGQDQPIKTSRERDSAKDDTVVLTKDEEAQRDSIGGLLQKSMEAQQQDHSKPSTMARGSKSDGDEPTIEDLRKLVHGDRATAERKSDQTGSKASSVGGASTTPSVATAKASMEEALQAIMRKALEAPNDPDNALTMIRELMAAGQTSTPQTFDIACSDHDPPASSAPQRQQSIIVPKGPTNQAIELSESDVSQDERPSKPVKYNRGDIVSFKDPTGTWVSDAVFAREVYHDVSKLYVTKWDGSRVAWQVPNNKIRLFKRAPTAASAAASESSRMSVAEAIALSKSSAAPTRAPASNPAAMNPYSDPRPRRTSIAGSSSDWTTPSDTDLSRGRTAESCSLKDMKQALLHGSMRSVSRGRDTSRRDERPRASSLSREGGRRRSPSRGGIRFGNREERTIYSPCETAFHVKVSVVALAMVLLEEGQGPSNVNVTMIIRSLATDDAILKICSRKQVQGIMDEMMTMIFEFGLFADFTTEHGPHVVEVIKSIMETLKDLPTRAYKSCKCEEICLIMDHIKETKAGLIWPTARR